MAIRRYAKKHYEGNKAACIARAKAFTIVQRARLRALINDYLAEHPCVDCGEADLVVLEFDHRDRATKSFNVADGLRRVVSVARMLAEIAKCDVRCANCHRRKTHRERLDLAEQSRLSSLNT